MPKLLLTPKDLEAELPDLGRSTIYSLIKAGTIPSIRLGKKIFTPRPAFEAWLANCCACAVNPVRDGADAKQ